jgi:hypothetical protein
LTAGASLPGQLGIGYASCVYRARELGLAKRMSAGPVIGKEPSDRKNLAPAPVNA